MKTPRSPLRVLFIDENPLLINGLIAGLKRHGFDGQQNHSLPIALLTLSVGRCLHKHPFHVVVAEVELAPKLTLSQLVEQIRSVQSTIPVVLFSRRASETGFAEKALEAGAAACLLRPRCDVARAWKCLRQLPLVGVETSETS